MEHFHRKDRLDETDFEAKKMDLKNIYRSPNFKSLILLKLSKRLK